MEEKIPGGADEVEPAAGGFGGRSGGAGELGDAAGEPEDVGLAGDVVDVGKGAAGAVVGIGEEIGVAPAGGGGAEGFVGRFFPIRLVRMEIGANDDVAVLFHRLGQGVVGAGFLGGAGEKDVEDDEAGAVGGETVDQFGVEGAVPRFWCRGCLSSRWEVSSR